MKETTKKKSAVSKKETAKTTKTTSKSTKSTPTKAKTTASRGRTENLKPFQPGQSGNPSGRPKMSEAQKDALEELRKLAPRAVEVAKDILENEKDSRLRIKIVEMILDRTYGKPFQAIQVEDGVDHNITVTFESSLNEYAD